MTYSAEQFPPGSEERIEAVEASAGALCNAEDVVTDWGEYDEDYTENQSALSWEDTDVDGPTDISLT
jgi:hypothetical protein